MKLSHIFDGIGYIAIITYCWEVILQQFPHVTYWFQWVAFLILYCAAFFGVLVVVSNYLSEVDKISHKNKFLLRLRYSISGVALCGIFAFYNIGMFNKNTILYLLVGIVGVWSFLWGPNIFGRITERFTVHGQERSFLIPVDNPKTQSDIWPFHVVMLGLLFMPYVVKLLHK